MQWTKSTFLHLWWCSWAAPQTQMDQALRVSYAVLNCRCPWGHRPCWPAALPCQDWAIHMCLCSLVFLEMIMWSHHVKQRLDGFRGKIIPKSTPNLQPLRHKGPWISKSTNRFHIGQPTVNLQRIFLKKHNQLLLLPPFFFLIQKH